MDRSTLQTTPAMDRHANALATVADLVDRQLSPVGLHAINALGPKPGDTVLDVGCGAGQTLVQLAERIRSKGQVIGIDIASTLLSVARERCSVYPMIKLRKADAQTIDLPSTSLDGVYSRFGVMGFSDPPLAFKNFSRILKPNGRVAFCCWRAIEENELDRFPIEIAGRNHEVRATPYRFSDPDYVRELLEGTGFKDINCRSHDELVSCGGVNETLEVLLNVGALGQIVRETPSLRSEVESSLRKALLSQSDPSRVELTAAVWIVSAQTTD